MVFPAWISRPLAVSVPLRGTTVRRNDKEISAEVNGVAGGSAVCTVQPSGASTSSASVAPDTTPCGGSSQSVTGSVNVALPGSAAQSRRPQK